MKTQKQLVADKAEYRLRMYRINRENARIIYARLNIPEIPLACDLYKYHYQYKFTKVKEEILTRIIQDGMAIKKCKRYFRNYKEIALAAVAQNGMALLHTKLKNKKEIVLVAVANNGMALQYASKYLKNLKQIVMIAITQNYRALQFASPECRDDDDIVKYAVAQNVKSLRYVSQRCRGDTEIISIALDIHLSNFMYGEMRLDYEYLLIAIVSNRELLNALSIIDREVFNTRTIRLKKIRQEYGYFMIISNLKHNQDNFIAKMNNYGIEFASYFKKQITEYLGVSDKYGWKFPDGHLWEYVKKY